MQAYLCLWHWRKYHGRAITQKRWGGRNPSYQPVDGLFTHEARGPPFRADWIIRTRQAWRSWRIYQEECLQEPRSNFIQHIITPREGKVRYLNRQLIQSFQLQFEPYSREARVSGTSIIKMRITAAYVESWRAACRLGCRRQTNNLISRQGLQISPGLTWSSVDCYDHKVVWISQFVLLPNQPLYKS